MWVHFKWRDQNLWSVIAPVSLRWKWDAMKSDIMSSFNPLLACLLGTHFYLFIGSEFPVNLQNCVFFMWSSIHCLTWETLANTELSPHVAPTPSPQLITPTSVCWSPCLYVNGPPLSPWQHQYRIKSRRNAFGHKCFVLLSAKQTWKS